MLPPGQYDLTLTYTGSDGEKQKIQLPNLYASDIQQIDIEFEDTDVYRGGGDVLMSVPDPGSRELTFNFTAAVLPDADGSYLRGERPVARWRVTYMCMGFPGRMDCTNEVDATRFMEQGYEAGMFVVPELVESRS